MAVRKPPQRRVLDAAVDLFSEQGYAATSIREIARRADVSLDTIYARGGKSSIFLAAMEVVLSGTHDATPILEGPGMESVWDAPTLEAVVSGLVDATVRSCERSASMWSTFVEGASSDDALATALADKNEAMREQGRKTVEFLKERGLCRPDLDTVRAADLIWAEAHPSRYALLVDLAGWTTEAFRAQLIDSVLSLIAPSNTAPAGRMVACE